MLAEVPIAGLTPPGVPPSISYTLAIVGTNRVYVHFSEPVRVAGGGVPFSASLWSYSGAASVSSVQPIGPVGEYSQEAFILLSAPLPDTEVYAPASITVTSVLEDAEGNPLTSSTHRVSDLGLGVVEPTWARTAFSPPSARTLRVFDGTGSLVRGGDIILSATILASSQTAAATNLIYDIIVPSAYKLDGFWMPAPALPDLVPMANPDVRVRAQDAAIGAVRDYSIPETDPEYDDGERVEFLLEVGGLLCARTADSSDPRTVVPWLISLRDMAAQRGEVTIMSNVINPNAGETTEMRYTLSRPGLVTIQVFTLAGDLVQVLQRGTLSAGQHSVVWDGRNRTGRVVARGIYFIRIVGPGVDETRKVLLVK